MSQEDRGIDRVTGQEIEKGRAPSLRRSGHYQGAWGSKKEEDDVHKKTIIVYVVGGYNQASYTHGTCIIEACMQRFIFLSCLCRQKPWQCMS